ncbi:serine/threonine-protein kinase OXI1 [Punica granatum]|uniref:non-specific serine/threonine protein kinase n=1 Tax=Punica granatum TaxID=22663 RepID=A0A6P8ELA7_PUNGR|nr:serine/threonine-protein kinase OXI1 [Punica granatum]
MGDAAELHDQRDEDVPPLSLQQLRVVSAVGRGAKGVVFLVQSGAAAGEVWALKVILRGNIEKKAKGKDTSAAKDGNEYRRVSFEQQVLRQFDHRLLPKLRGVLATDKVVGYAIDYCPGRDLNSLRKKQTEKMFSDDIIRFYAAELVLALEYLHELGIVYRDLKPENIMIQEDGHVMLVDFDLSTKLSSRSPRPSPPPRSVPTPDTSSRKRVSSLQRWCSSGFMVDDSDAPHHRPSLNSVFPAESDSVEKSNSFVGTEEYVAPEVILGEGHDFAVDWWCLGVVLYEMLYGTTPFRGSNRKETFYRILSKAPELVGEPTPLRDLIGRLLEKDPRQRIGLEGIKGHEFFRGVAWDSIVEIARPPYIPASEFDEEEVDSKGIDVELFVEGIFGSGESEKNNNGGDNGNKKAWVEELNDHQPPKIDNFLVF